MGLLIFQANEVPRIMKTVMYQVIEGRPKEDTMSEWMMKSLTNLSKVKPKSSTKITPIASPGNQH